jgi:hypothetical protein
MFFNCSKIVGGNIKIVGISQYYIRVTALFVDQISLKENGRQLCLNLCMNFKAEY